MTFKYSVLLILILSISCGRKRDTATENPLRKEEPVSIKELLSYYPQIKDTAAFFDRILPVFDIELTGFQDKHKKIFDYRKIRLNGSDKDYFLIEFEHGQDCLATYPWKFQLIFTPEGKPVKALKGDRCQLLTIFPEENPFLLVLLCTARGNGGHEIYKVSADTLENVYEGYYDYDLRTYDAHQDGFTYEPWELNLTIRDYNADGVNDIAFTGAIVPENPLQKPIPVEYIFIYNKKDGHFKAKEDYHIKYNPPYSY